MGKRLFPTFVKYVSQSVMGMVGISCYILADTWFVAAAFGAEGLAALNLAIVVYSLMNAAGLMAGIGGATLFSLSFAAGRERRAEIFSSTAALGLFFAVIFTGAGLFFSGGIARLLGADEVIFAMTRSYLRTILSFSLFFIMNNIFLAFVRNDGSPRLAMAAMVTGSLSNIALDYLFIFPFGWGLFGAALATAIAPMISLALLSLHFVLRRSSFRPSLRRLRAGAVAKMIPLGLSSMVTELSSAAALAAFNLMILAMAGNTGVAAYGIVANLALVELAVFVGIAQGMQPLVSRSRGAGDGHSCRLLLFYGAVLSLAVASLAYGTVFVWARQVAGLFNSAGDALLAAYAEEGLRIYFAGFFFGGLNVVAAAFCSAAEMPKRGFLISSLRAFLLVLPLAALFSWLFGMRGLWFSFVAAEALTFIAASVMLRRFIFDRANDK